MSKYISNWLVLGPIFNESDQVSESQHHEGDGHPKAGDIIRDIDKNSINPEAITRSLDNAPQDGDVVSYGNGGIYSQQEYTWRSLNFSQIDWNNINEIRDNIHKKLPSSDFSGKHHALAFFLTYIESPSEKGTVLCVRSDDSIRVWLNGRELRSLRYEGERDIVKHPEEICSDITLVKGSNILMVAVADAHVAWGLSVKIEEEDGLKFSTTKPSYVETVVRHDIFKFVALRPPTKPKTKSRELLSRIVDRRQPSETLIGKIVHDLGDNADIERVLPPVKQLINQKNWTSENHRDQDVTAIAAVHRAIDEQLQNFSSEGFLKSIKEALGVTPKDFVQSEQARSTRQGLWDRLQAFYLLNRETPVNLEELTDGLRAFHIVELLAKGEKFNSADELREALSAVITLPEALVRITPAKPADRPRIHEQQERDKVERERFVGLWTKYVELNKASEEIQLLEPKIEVERGEPKPIQERVAREDSSPSVEEQQTVRRLFTTTLRRSVTFAKADVDRLSVAARMAVAEASKEPERFAKPDALNRIHKELAFVTNQLFTINDPRLVEVMPTEAKPLPAAMAIAAKNLYSSPLEFNSAPSPFPFSYSIQM